MPAIAEHPSRQPSLELVLLDRMRTQYPHLSDEAPSLLAACRAALDVLNTAWGPVLGKDDVRLELMRAIKRAERNALRES